MIASCSKTIIGRYRYVLAPLFGLVDLDDHQQDLESVITTYLLSIERGETPDCDEILAAHPHLAVDLRDFFEADLRFRGNLVAETINKIAPNPVADPPICQQLGEYDLEKEIARGGMGIVYRARHRRLGRVVALKTLLTGRFSGPEEIDRFYAEAKAAAKLDHPGIVPIHEISQEDGIHYYTMPLIDGESLADRLQRGPLQAEKAAALICQAARAVAYAHEHRLLHRDLKPGNVLLDQDKQPKITDFGLAKSLDDEGNLTATGEILGTLQFMAPEQAAAKHNKVAEPADIYSLGAILFTCLTGEPIFTSSSQVELLLQVLESEPPPPRRLAPHVPRDLESICLRCLEKDPARRYTSAAELAKDLERFLAQEPVLAEAGRTWNRIRRWGRQKPLLVAHGGVLLLVELSRQLQHIFRDDFDTPFQSNISLTIGIWIMACITFEKLHGQLHGKILIKYLWAATDAILLTLCLILVQESIGILPVTYGLLIVVSGIFFRVRLVFFTTILCILSFGVLMIMRPQLAPLHYAIVFVAVLYANGCIVGYHVHRLRIMSRFYDKTH